VSITHIHKHRLLDSHSSIFGSQRRVEQLQVNIMTCDILKPHTASNLYFNCNPKQTLHPPFADTFVACFKIWRDCLICELFFPTF